MNQDFFVAGGTLRSDAPSYVTREADAEIERLALAGQLCYVLTTRQMGKSSLMTRTAHRLRQRSVPTAIIDLTAIGTATIDEWYVSILDDLQGQLGLLTDVETWWFSQQHLSPVRRFSKFLREVLPGEVEGTAVIFIDEVDTALKLPFSDDFFAALRALFNQATERSPLSIILLGVAHPNDLIQDTQRTPFNIGNRIRLEELPLAEARPIFAHGLPIVAPAVLDRIFYWTNGHPYLTQKIALAIARHHTNPWGTAEVDRLVHELFITAHGRTEDSNIQFVAGRVLNSPNRPALLRLYRQLLGGTKIGNDETSDIHSELKLYGLVKADSANMLMVRNRIYATAFDNAWVNQWLPRRHAHLWLGSLLVILLLATLGWSLWQRQQNQAALLALNVAQFEESADAGSRLNSLGRIIELGETETAVSLFQQLPTAEQTALFANADTAQATVIAPLIKTTYQTLYTPNLAEDSASTPILQAMAQAVERLPSATDPTLGTEIESWLRARASARTNNDEQARIEYSVAIALNPKNGATRYERALINLRLEDTASALADLHWLSSQATWQEQVASLVASSVAVHSAIRADANTYRQLAKWVPPVPTEAITSTQPTSLIPAPSPTALAAATVMITPEPMVTQTAVIPPPTPSPETSSPLYEKTAPAGTIVYTCFIGNVDQLCTINPDGSNQQQITFSGTTDWYGSPSPTGDIYFSGRRTTTFGIYHLSPLTQAIQLLTPPQHGDYSPELSPDGSQIVFTRTENGRQNIWLMDADGSNPQSLTQFTDDALDPTWSPNGQQIAFARRTPNGSAYTHYIINRDGSDLRQITTPIEHIGGRSDWSPDGQWLAFYAGERNNRNIYLVNPHNNHVWQVTQAGDNLAPAWSPDGNWLVFTSYRDGDNELYIMRPDGTDMRQLTHNNTADWQPRWGP